ncbi:bleomycin resistance protein [Acinetobacter sp. WCHAc060033]|uniref:bleomycin resistance protein n=1 Tax=Acinetobacter sp. WCHAc060033 TaxID=2518624 RepID=UPI001023CA86|nr:bleomycin resistance protein [Acinetobacter sp. WCHAc060033]RZG78960.1 bleomycin resistance protein [Acinetobacter sp. WCHAc060033]
MLINLIVLKVKNIERTRQFYSQFGLVFKSEQHGNGPEHYSCNLNGLIFEIYPALDDLSNLTQNIRLGFCVENLSQLFENITDIEKIISPPQNTPFGFRAVIKKS